MTIQSGYEREKAIRSITFRGVAVNAFLIIIKLISGMLIRSSALIADSVHSISDLTTDFVVLIGTRLSQRPPDATHPYGHKKFETIACQIIAFILIVVSFGLFWSAGASIYYHRQNFPGFMMLIIAAISVVAKEVLFFTTRKIARVTGSAALYANAWHHRSDSLSSMAVLIGGVASLLGWGYADQTATVFVALMIMGVAGKIFFDGVIELTEHSADRESIHNLERVLTEEKEISGWHALRTRKFGGELFADVHILVDSHLSVLRGHEITEKIEEKIKRALSNPVNVLIHIEPSKSQEKSKKSA